MKAVKLLLGMAVVAFCLFAFYTDMVYRQAEAGLPGRGIEVSRPVEAQPVNVSALLDEGSKRLSDINMTTDTVMTIIILGGLGFLLWQATKCK